MKLCTNSPVSHLGIIFKLPNKYTEKEELYLLEITKNNDSFLDAFREVPHSGVCLFRCVAERV